MKYLSALFACLVLMLYTACAKPPKAPPTTPELAQYAIARTVALLAEDGDMFCGAVWVSDGKLLTANHCVEYMAQGAEDDTVGLEIDYRENTGLTGETITLAVDPLHDLALLGAPGAKHHGFVKLASSPPVIGQWVFFMGHPGGSEWSYMEGHIANMHLGIPGLDVMGPFIQVQAPIFHGNSGGPAMDSEGRLVGIVSMGSAAIPDVGLLVHTDTIRAFLQSNHVQ